MDVEALRARVVQLSALISAIADTASAIRCDEPLLERAQGMLELAERQSGECLEICDQLLRNTSAA